MVRQLSPGVAQHARGGRFSERCYGSRLVTEKMTAQESDRAAAPSRDHAPQVQRAYLERIAELSQTGKHLAERDARLSSLRGIAFVAMVGGGIYGLFRSSAQLWLFVAGATVVFIAFVVRHAMVSTRQFEAQRRLDYCQRGIDRIAGTYRAKDDEAHLRGETWVDPEHAYTSDLDIFGHASLFEQLNVTQTPGGTRRLANWLLHAAPSDEVAARQQAARELGELGELREEMALAGMHASKTDRDLTKFLEWAKQPADFAKTGKGITAFALLLVITSLSLFVMSAVAGGLWTRIWLGAVALQLVVMTSIRPRIEAVLAPVCIQQSPLGTYRYLLSLIENSTFEDARLTALRGALMSSSTGAASEQMRRLDRLNGMAAVRHNGIVHFIADLFLMWDVWSAWLIDRWRARVGARVPAWLDALSELEALSALATFASEHPDYAWPRIDEAEPHFEATELGHPLIAAGKRVVNDVAFTRQAGVLMITGSNMSGKSTMLRSIGIAAVLAHAGGPVCAHSLSMSSLQVHSSLRISDALDRGASRFYMEVRKLKDIVDRVNAGESVLFLLDEVLHGTNSRERNIGAKAVVQHLLDKGAIGAVSSHDLGLVELEQLTEGRVRNTHFEDHIEDGKMCFDYRMKPGAVSTSNALRLMRMVGIDVVPAGDPEG